MNRDLKLGLSFGILCIGLIAAFCLKNEPDLTAGLPELENPEQLDRQIADQQVTPYLEGLDDFPSGPAISRVTPPSDNDWTSISPSISRGSGPIGAPVSFGKLISDGPSLGRVPDPIRYESLPPIDPIGSDLPPIARDRAAPTDFGSRPEQPIRNDYGVSGRDMGGRGMKGKTLPTTHVVMPNETLSGIAVKYYGDPSYYGKIFDANRHLLNDPDSVRVGMRLMIPEIKPFGSQPQSGSVESIPTGPTAVQPISSPRRADLPASGPSNSHYSSTAATPTQVASLEEDDAKPNSKRFVPVSRPPFVSSHKIEAQQKEVVHERRSTILDSTNVREPGK